MPEPLQFNESQKNAYKAAYAPNASAEQFALFIEECERRRLIPGTHVVFQLRNAQEWNQQLQRSVSVQKVTLITTINALRLIAERSGHFRGYGETLYYYSNPEAGFAPTTTSPIPLGKIPHAVSIKLFREGWREAVFAVARYDAYVQTKKDGNKEVPTRMWTLRGEEQLAKCAEAAGLRMVAPEECGGLYIAEEFEREIKEEETPLEKLKDLAAHCVPGTLPAPTVAPPVNQAPAPVEIETPGAGPGEPMLPAPKPPAPAPISRPAAPPVARPIPPPLPSTPKPTPVSAPPVGHNPASLNCVSAPEGEAHESPAELAVVADAVARDKDPKTGPFANTVPPNPENETRAFVTPAQPAPAPTVAAGDAPATPKEYADFVNGRGAKIVRDKLKEVKNAGPMMKDYLLRESGKQKLQAIGAATFERLISTLETATVEEAVKLLKGGK